MTAALMHGHDLIGRPVVDASTGDDVAEVRDVVFDPSAGRITGFTLRRRGFLGRRMKQVLPIGETFSVGTDAVMVADSSALTDRDDAPDDVLAEGGGNVLADQVVTESGRSLGTLKDVVIVGGREPRVVAFEVAGGPVGDGLVPLGRHSAVSGSALIVPDGFEQRIRTDLTGLAGELALLEGERS
ncbi:MAG: PRC-barrel domain-containing protein [Ilumatobacteraceae bacterium]